MRTLTRMAGFNSRSRMGSDGLATWWDVTYRVSIHAPAWGATVQRARLVRDFAVSIHAPAWGATSLDVWWGCNHASFNSRSRMGSDITAPRPVRGFLLFQFTLPHGERRRNTACYLLEDLFQFTLPHGERLPLPPPRAPARRFNSRSRMGSDKTDIIMMIAELVSIHAPAWGATRGAGGEGGARKVSIHAPAWGATRSVAFFAASRVVSIHAPAWGATCISNC